MRNISDIPFASHNIMNFAESKEPTMIKCLLDKYPYTEAELETLVRCHGDLMRQKKSHTTYLERLAKITREDSNNDAGEEWVVVPSLEKADVSEKMLPSGFGSRLEGVIDAAFVFSYSDSSNKESVSLEIFLEGIAMCIGRRGVEASRRSLFSCCQHEKGSATAGLIIDLCYRLAAASNVLCPHTDREYGISDGVSYIRGLEPLVNSLADVEENGTSVPIPIKTFLNWADKIAPMIASTLETFLEILLFGSINRARFRLPDLQGQSSVFFDENLSCSRLFELSCLAPCFCGEVSEMLMQM